MEDFKIYIDQIQLYLNALWVQAQVLAGESLAYVHTFLFRPNDLGPWEFAFRVLLKLALVIMVFAWLDASTRPKDKV